MNVEYLPWIITLATVLIIYFLDRWENKHIKSIFDWFPSLLLAYIIPALVTGFAGINFSKSYIHTFSRDFLVPLAIVTVMSSLSFRQLKNMGWKPVLVFLSGSFWIAFFPVMFFWLFKNTIWVQNTFISTQYWKGLPPIVGSWIGGSTSQLVLKELVNCPENIFLIILVLDSLLVNIWTLLMFKSIKSSNFLNKFLGIKAKEMPQNIFKQFAQALSPIICFLFLIVLVILSHLLFENFIAKIIFLSISGLLISNILQKWNFEFVLNAGGIFILIVMSILGLKLTFAGFELNTYLILFLSIWLLGHFVFMLFTAKLLNVNTAWVSIASMANVGGIATAPAVTAAFEKKWMPHAVILAILSMGTGTFWGMLTIYFFKVLSLN